MTGAASRRSASFGLSLLLHAALGLVLAAGGAVTLVLEPAPLLLTFLEASDRTAGPGEPSPDLRVAAPGGAAAGAEPSPRPVDPEVVVDPEEKVVVAIPAPVKTAPKPPARTPPTPARPAVEPGPKEQPVPDVASAGTGPGEGSPLGQSGGSGSVSSAPAWSPVAKVRYEELLFAWMNRYKQYPLLARRRGIEGGGAVRVRIGRDGRVVEHALQRSTGQALLDEAAMEMVRRASPFPEVPGEYAGSSFEFVAPIEFRLR